MTTPMDPIGQTRAQSVRAEERPAANRGIRAGINNIKSSATQVADAGKVLTRLAPKQLKDEVAIAKIEVKEKGIAVGKGAAVVAVAVIFALFMAIALVILAYVGLAAIMPNWAAALVLVGLFLLLAAVLGFVGYKMIMKQLPFKPESAIFGVLYDLGVLKEGSAMTSKRVKREQAEKAEAKKAESEENKSEDSEKTPAAPAPNKEQLIQRTKQRREHLKTLRDDIQNHATDVQTRAKGLSQEAKYSAKNTPATAASTAAANGRNLVNNASDPETLQAHWKSFAALVASLGAFFVFLGKLIRRK